MPRLEWLNCSVNGIGSAGLIALAPALRALPRLKTLEFNMNGIGDDAVAALAAPGEGVLQSLETLSLHNNEVGDAGCAALVAALERGTVPSLESVGLEAGNQASLWARAAVDAATQKEQRRRARTKTS